MNKIPRSVVVIAVVMLIIIADQALKIWVKTNMTLGEAIDITSWFKIHFVENPGMAFGIEIIGKLFLTIFRIIAVCFIVYYLSKIIKEKYSYGYLACIALILAGAFGNIIDCVFYGEIFSESTPYEVARFVPIGEGYGTWMHGKVVDMFDFPLFEITFPNWIPVIGGSEFKFFNAIFNIADAAISVGIIILLLFYRRTFSHSLESDKTKKDKEDLSDAK